MDCCEVPRHEGDGRAPCPSCGAVGKEVSDATILALLAPEASRGLLAVERRFCRTPDCDVLYYGADGRRVTKQASKVRVGQKETLDPVQLCYCFGHFRSDVRVEVARTGQCTLPSRITAEIRAGRCACEIKNPSGSCCLGEVNRAVKEAQEALATSRASGGARGHRSSAGRRPSSGRAPDSNGAEANDRSPGQRHGSTEAGAQDGKG